MKRIATTIACLSAASIPYRLRRDSSNRVNKEWWRFARWKLSIDWRDGRGKKDAGPLCWLLCRRDPFSPIFLSSLRPFGFWRLFFLLLAIDNKQRIISVSGNGLLVCLFSPPESASLSNYWQNVCWRICVGDNLGERNTNTLRGVYHGCVRVATLVG